MKKIFFTLAIAASFVAGCKKKDEATVVPESVAKKNLTSASWLLKKYGYRSSNGSENIHPISGCEADNESVFKGDNNFIADEGEQKCYSNNPQTIISGTWEFVDGEKKLKFPNIYTKNRYTYVHNITELTATSLKLEIPYEDGSGVSFYEFVAK